jgi:secernin
MESGGVPGILQRAGRAGRVLKRPDRAVKDTFSGGSYWWLFRRLLDLVKGDELSSRPGLYNERLPEVRKRFDRLEAEFVKGMKPAFESFKKRGKDRSVLYEYTEKCVNKTVEHSKDLINIFRKLKPL